MAEGNIEQWTRKQRSLLEQEKLAERSEIVEWLTTLNAAECQQKGISLISLVVREISTGLFGRTIISVGDTKNRQLISNRFSSGDEVTLLSSKGAEGTCSIVGVIGTVTDESLQIITDDEKEEAFSLKAPLRLNILASEATHKKLLQGLTNLERPKTDIAKNVVDAIFGISTPNLLMNADTVKMPLTFFNANLNEGQREAIAFALATNDVALIHGPPGTGKTTAVVELISQAVSLGWKVLVTAPSNVAVDNVLEKLINYKEAITQSGKPSSHTIPILPVRIGHPARMLPFLLRYSLDALLKQNDGSEIVDDAKSEMQGLLMQLRNNRGESKRSIHQQLKALRKEIRLREEKIVASVLKERNVIMATCVGASARILQNISFDLVIIDEAAQALEVACWLPALLGRRLVLAGDHKQLPPTIKSNAAAHSGLGITLFDRLLNRYGSGISRMLHEQYRMHEDICGWASGEMYDGKLRSHFSSASRLISELAHVQNASDMTAVPLLLLDTAGCDMDEETILGGSTKNPKEAEVVSIHVRSLIQVGLKPSEIAVITPYNGQVEVLKNMLKTDFPTLEIRSVDGFQGGEREAVVLSLVRSNPQGHIGFLADERRINVAVTRAKRHCAIVCDSECISRHAFFARLVKYFEEKGEYRSALEIIPQADISGEATAAVLEQLKILNKTNEGISNGRDASVSPENIDCSNLLKETTEKNDRIPKVSRRSNRKKLNIDDGKYKLMNESEVTNCSVGQKQNIIEPTPVPNTHHHEYDQYNSIKMTQVSEIDQNDQTSSNNLLLLELAQERKSRKKNNSQISENGKTGLPKMRKPEKEKSVTPKYENDEDDMALLDAEIKKNRADEPCYARVLKMTTDAYKAENPKWDPNKPSVNKKRTALADQLSKKIEQAGKERSAKLKDKKK